jgi:oxygen-independent coproporphyrinogen-3 oxidase
LATDDLYKAWLDGNLHRNFMGYTTQKTSLLLGLGVSSISDSFDSFAQNKKQLHEYYQSIKNNKLPLLKGYFLDEEDKAFRKYILNITCKGFTTFIPAHSQLLEEYTFPELKKLEADGLIEFSDKEIMITSTGRHFIRNICRAFDLHLLRSQQSPSRLFSQAI